MITKNVNPTTKTAIYTYPEYSKVAPIQVSVMSSFHASVLHDIYIRKFITSELQKFISQRRAAYQSKKLLTTPKLRAIDDLLYIIRNFQEAKLLSLAIQITKCEQAIRILSPGYTSPVRKHFDRSIGEIQKYCADMVSKRAPYAIQN